MPRRDRALPRLCVICDADVCARAGWALVDFASACLDGGATFLQLRSKSAASRWMLETAQEVVRRAESGDALVVVNDRADIARLAGAGGVHVGQEDLDARAVRLIVGNGAIVGLSTHTVPQIDAALAEPIDYLAVGPVFDTATKSTGYSGVGLARVREAASRAAPFGHPVVAIGGITLDRAADVVAAGARSVAVISDLLTGDSPTARVRTYLDRLAASAGR